MFLALTPLVLAASGRITATQTQAHHPTLESDDQIAAFASSQAPFVPSYYQSAYRLNYRPGAKYIVDCDTGVSGLADDQTCIDYCKGNTLEPMYKPDLEAALTSWPECRYAVRSQETLDTYSGNGTFFQSEWEMDYLEDSSLLQYSLSWDLASMMSPSVSETGPLAPSFSKISFKVYYAAVGGYAAERGNGTVVGTIRVAEGVSSVAGTCIPMSLQASEVVEQEVDIEVWGYPIVMDWSEDYFVDLDPTYNSTRVDTGPSLASGQVLFDFEFDHPELFTEWEQARRLMTAVAATNPEQAIAGNTPNAQGNYSENILRTSNYGKSSQSATEEWNPASNQAFSICLALKVDLEHIVDNQGVENSIVMNTGLPYRTVAVMESLNHYEVLAGASAEVLPIEDDCPFQCDCRYDLVRNDPWFHGTNEGAVDEAVYAKGTRCARDPLACPGDLILATSLAKSVEPDMAFYKPQWKISADRKLSFF